MSNDPSIQRRKFLAAAGAATTVCVAGLATPSAAASKKSLYNYMPKDFDNLIGCEFPVMSADSSGNKERTLLVLRQVVRHDRSDTRPRHLRQEGFSLLFSGPRESKLENGTHRVSCGGQLSADLFLHQTREWCDPTRSYYEVVFN